MKELTKEKEVMIEKSIKAKPPKSAEDGKQKAIDTAKKYGEVFGTPLGKEVLNDFLSFCGFFEVSSVANDPITTGFRDGKRAAALELIKQLQRARYINDIADIVKI